MDKTNKKCLDKILLGKITKLNSIKTLSFNKIILIIITGHFGLLNSKPSQVFFVINLLTD